ncbi:hypothetical protein [Halorussus pelagicus]|uniref:hypothetical protein n=1 Tax=Halorussus pelagicus TaxID=2505977 RepID=UPI000FFC1564|nr:hypothetical protein [Halorussus pelagicus]
MDDYERVPIEDWNAVADHLREFGAGGELAESDEGIEVTVGSATLLVTKDGRVAAGMPLHDFEDGAVEALYFDHDAETVRVEGGDVSYEFRKP